MKHTSGRLLMALCLALVGGNMWDTATFVLWQHESTMRSLASLTHYPDHLAWTYLGGLLLMIPFAAAQLVPACRWEREFAKAAMLGLFVAGFLWMALAFAGRHTDLSVVRMSCVRSSIEALVLMLLTGSLLNAQLRRRNPMTDGQIDLYRDTNRVPLGEGCACD